MENFVRKKLSSSKSLSEILRQARKKKGISLEEAEEEIKVRAKYLQALEEGRFDQLPESVYALGFLAKYADFLDLNKDDLIGRFKIERGENSFSSKLMPERKIKDPIISITPRLMIILVIVIFLVGLMGYILFNVKHFTSPPNLEIISPSADEIIKEDKVEIIGKTDEGVTLSINNQPVLIDDKGNFRQQVKLNQGLNAFEVKAVNRLKKERTKTIKILSEY